MRHHRFAIPALVLILLLGTALSASAQVTVKVFKPREDEVTATELRKQAMDLGFAEAVGGLAQRLLPCPLSEIQGDLLRQVMEERAATYVLSYSELEAEHSAEGFRLSMEVEVDRRLLRDDLRAMGIYAGCSEHLAFSFLPGEGLTEEDTAGIRDMALMTGMTMTPGVSPQLSMSRVGEDLLNGQLTTDAGTWAASGHNPAAVWIGLWGKYFARQDALTASQGGEILMVSGWFTPDGVFEFDRVLQEWDQAVREVQLIDVDLDPAGVGARWDLRVTDQARLNVLLDDWLAGRGLEYSLVGGTAGY